MDIVVLGTRPSRPCSDHCLVESEWWVMPPYVHSNYARIKDDNYQTVDSRCIQALVDTVALSGRIIDCCSPDGSGIVDSLKGMGYLARGVADAFGNFEGMWVVSNPPYKRGLVDKIINAQIDRLGNVEGVAMLLRNNFDFAKSRYIMFTSPYYYGQIHMMFRPWWSEDKKAQPIHNFVWHIWRLGTGKEPVVKYWKES